MAIWTRMELLEAILQPSGSIKQKITTSNCLEARKFWLIVFSHDLSSVLFQIRRRRCSSTFPSESISRPREFTLIWLSDASSPWYVWLCCALPLRHPTQLWPELKAPRSERFSSPSVDDTLSTFSLPCSSSEWVSGVSSWELWPSDWSLVFASLESSNPTLSTKFSDSPTLSLSPWPIRTPWKEHTTPKYRSDKPTILEPIGCFLCSWSNTGWFSSGFDSRLLLPPMYSWQPT